jgi:hypothetical protein
VRQPLAQPPFDPLGRDEDQLFSERIGQGSGQKGAKGVGEEVCSFSTV